MSAKDREKWNAKYGASGLSNDPPAAFLASLDALLPRRGRALDVAGGVGRNAIWLARRGLETTLVDVSEVALGLAARSAGDVPLKTVAADLDVDSLPPGPWDVIASFNFLWRELFDVVPALLAPGGLLVYSQPTRSNLARHAKPPEGFLLDDGELPGLVRSLELIQWSEGWTDEGRHEARLVARRPAD